MPRSMLWCAVLCVPVSFTLEIASLPNDGSAQWGWMGRECACVCELRLCPALLQADVLLTLMATNLGSWQCHSTCAQEPACLNVLER